MPTRRLIIGCGYLGQRVADRWLQSEDAVFALTRSPAHAEQFRRQGIVPIIGDVVDSASLQSLPEVDTVLWAVGWDRASARSMDEVYVGGLENVCRVMRTRSKRFISISSTSVYGQNQGEWVDEESICQPLLANGKTCLAAEQVLANSAITEVCGSRLETTVLRLSGIYGPGRLLSRTATLKNGDALNGNPDAWLNLIHVDDAADMVVKCAAAHQSPRLLLVSDDEPVRRRDYYSALAARVGAPPPRFVVEEREALPTELELNKRCRNSLSKSNLGWSPRFPTYREGLLHSIDLNG